MEYVSSTFTEFDNKEGMTSRLRTFLVASDPSYTLFRAEDLTAWLTFSVVFVCLIAFDNHFMNSKAEHLTVVRAMRYTMFWIAMACCFCGWVWMYYGKEEAFMWMSGYMLEWMLSFDNLFVFHLIFSVYGTPEHLKHRPLYLGICGAVFFRLMFIFIGEYLMHTMFLMHFIFGAFLVYTGIKTISADDDDEDPSQNSLVQWLQAQVPFISFYDKSGAFFVKVPVDEAGQVIVQEDSNLVAPSSPGNGGSDSESIDNGMMKLQSNTVAGYGTIDGKKLAAVTPQGQQWQLRATMLFLVVCCLEISDMIFAVDSVSAIVAQVNDLFLAYTSAVFAMLGLRATFFVIDVLVHMFSLLKYGVAMVLVFIGIKLCISHVYTIPPGIVVLVLLLAIGGSMVASVVAEELEKKAEGEHFSDIDERVEKVKAEHRKTSPESTPQLAENLPRQQIAVV
eukprot:TRINITY_DN5263_c0_g1_i1.p1 TRINITY_DN5263_c0_g1~~TRINITY_DN5263_c0_g1_i1.p1  ORF type:complete len:449 (+),score=104.74 TRINITY_DN5263_c0_g1_i1:89-1435(+)